MMILRATYKNVKEETTEKKTGPRRMIPGMYGIISMAQQHGTAPHGRARHRTTLRSAEELALRCAATLGPGKILHARNSKNSKALGTAQHRTVPQRTAGHGRERYCTALSC